VKTKLVLAAAMFTVLVSSAQTNSIMFPLLLSPTNSVLMTNAEFRVISGAKIFFKNNAGYRMFYPGQLNSNVLAALHTSIPQLVAQQQKIIDDAAQAYAEAHPVYVPPPPPVDDFFESAKTEMNNCQNSTELDAKVDSLINSLNDSYSEIIENAEIHDASATEINNLEIQRDEEKVKVLSFAKDLATKQVKKAEQGLTVAESNQAAFNSDPIGYLSKSTNAADRKLAKDLSEQTNTPSR
jgi:hypothetical protein